MARAMKRLLKSLSIVLVAVLLILSVLQTGTVIISRTWRAWSPTYEMEDISSLFDKSVLTDSDYDTLYRQTGLTRLGIDGLLADGKIDRILDIQEDLFDCGEYAYNVFDPYTGIFEKKNGGYAYAELEAGDILYTPASYFSCVRLGHTAIVTETELGSIAEVQGYGSGFEVGAAYDFFTCPAFVVLRVNADAETRTAVAEYVLSELRDSDYDILAGIFGAKAPKTLKKTHCSHMIWYAFNSFGIDLDSDGGKIVTPKDILNSPLVSVVQVFGMDIEKFGQNAN